MSESRDKTEVSIVSFLIALAVCLLFLTAPKDLDFWWWDAPEHAMNGALIHDFIAAGAFARPYQFAVDYYLRYPALTISLYPPLFYTAEAGVYTVLGVSHFSAQLTVALFSALFAFFLYKLVRFASPPMTAGAIVLSVLATPAIALWSRQVMLEIPALSLLVGSAYFLLRHLNDGAARWLYLAVILFVAAVYTKQAAGFAIIPFVFAVIYQRRVMVFSDRTFWFAGALAAAMLLPLVIFTILITPSLFINVTGMPNAPGQQFTWSGFAWYAFHMPEITGIFFLGAAALYLTSVTTGGWRNNSERLLGVLMILWFVSDYLFISLMAYRQARYGFFLSVPVTVLAIGFLTRVLPGRVSPMVALAVGCVAFSVTLATNDVPRISGYRNVASYIVQQVGEKGIILFHGHRSPDFIFAMRQLDGGAYIPVLRADKLLVSGGDRSVWGATDRGKTETDIQGIFDRFGIVYVVFQPDFWTDLPSLAELQRVVYSDRFIKVAEFPIAGTVGHDDHKIEVFRNLHPTNPANSQLKLDIPLLQRRIEGNFK